ncbi:hypothetical protein [Marininema mesophilum]|uniref:hypothetical protein n=1 Tax=Marininema mesophilum TaxID=1048340 RepID=UPI000B8A539F|nr:hypothetical protein [Marininema mesophilum]
MKKELTQLSLDIERKQASNNRPHMLLSIRPQPFNDIKREIKRYEYRRKFVNEPVNAFLYVSSPIKSLCGYVEFGQPIVGSVEKISRIAENEVPGWGEGVVSYLAGLDQGVAVPINFFKEIEPISLEELRRGYSWFTAPQLYLRLKNKPDFLTFLLNKLK